MMGDYRMKSWLKKLFFLCFGLSLTQTLIFAADAPECAEASKNQVDFKSCQWLKTETFLDKQAAFFQFTPGLGFVYFSGLKGDLSGQPAVDFNPFNNTPLKRGLYVNRGPVFEASLGYRFLPWLSLAATYEYMGQLAVKSVMNPSSNAAATISVNDVFSQFQADLSLNAILAKFTLQSPYAFIWRSFSTTPYFSVAIGPGWQSWTRVQINRQFTGGASNVFFSEPQFLRQKISANAVWSLDFGVNVLRVRPQTDFSLIAGCKFIDWGQARSMGKITQQEGFKAGLIHPVRVKMVYSFNPYLGVQWNFPTLQCSCKSFQLMGKNPNTFKPYFVSLKTVESFKNGFVQFNAGPNFLYFSDLKGSLFGRPDSNFALWGNVQISGSLGVNKVPLFESLWGYQFAPWIKGALSYQHAAGMTVQTKMLNGQTLTGVVGSSDFSQFQANLGLDAISLKAYLQLPRGMVFKALVYSPYLAIGGGVSWQSWTNMQINRSDIDTVGYNADPQPIRQKIIASGLLMLDAGIRLQSVLPENNLLFSMGCKYNQWGQVRNLGQISDQNSLRRGLNDPIRIKLLYSFVPYLGVQWNFPLAKGKENICKIHGKSIARFLPFYTHNREMQAQQSPFIQYNVGLGFLYFDGFDGTLTGNPAAAFRVFGPISLKGSIIYNRSPLFEYLVGYRFTQWFKAAISYQNQANVNFQSEFIEASQAPPLAGNFQPRYGQFQANLSLNSIMAKVYFELPYSMVSTGCAFTTYLGFGGGPGWQSWTQIQVNRIFEGGSFVCDPQNLRQKISGNMVWMADLGARIHSARPCSPFSVTIGCKYIQWGQARSMGKISDQQTSYYGLIQPIHIRMVYSFAPYLGMQWNF